MVPYLSTCKEDQVSCHILAVPCIALLRLVPFTWSHSMFSTIPCLLYPSTLVKGEEKGGENPPRNSEQLRFSYFFPFCHYRTLYVLNICQHSLPKLSALNSPMLFNTSLGILIPLFLSNFIFFSLLLSSFLYFPPLFFTVPLTPAGKKEKKKKGMK